MRGKALKNYGTVAAGIVVGGVNGVIVAKFGILSFITTLGMGTVLDGVIYGLTGGTTVFNGIPKSFMIPGILKIAGISFITIVAVVLYLVFHIFMNHMAAGRKLYAIGGSEEAAKVAGIRIFRYRVLAFTLCAALAGLIGCEAAGRGVNTAETAATIATGRLGIFHGMKSYFCQDEYGQIARYIPSPQVLITRESDRNMQIFMTPAAPCMWRSPMMRQSMRLSTFPGSKRSSRRSRVRMRSHMR